jgi:hypothetical protein
MPLEIPSTATGTSNQRSKAGQGIELRSTKNILPSSDRVLD